jgi:hypothetical protein
MTSFTAFNNQLLFLPPAISGASVPGLKLLLFSGHAGRSVLRKQQSTYVLYIYLKTETKPAPETLHLFNKNEHMESVQYMREVNFRHMVFFNIELTLF